jgi:DNA-binding LytR/AlgR family response regulator
VGIIIIEDEQLAADNLEKLILSIDNSIKIIAKLESVRNSVKWLSQNTCDLIFMDIQLSDGNSFSIFEQLDVKIPVIFTTAYDQFAIKAFKHNSIDYLLKPINAEELKQSLLKYKQYYQNTQLPDFKMLLESLKPKKEFKERFLVNAGQKILSLKTNEIAYFFAHEKGVFLCTFANKQFDVDYTLEQLENILEPKIFFRINRQYIVNIEAIQNMNIVSKSRLKLELKPNPESEVIVSFGNMHEFKIWLNR